jgi:hypothetical protein
MKLTCALIALITATSYGAAIPESAKIDAILAKEWQKNGLQPNAPASDEVFLRRIYVDIVGRIPTIEEARAFLGSAEKDKRTKLIDQLLASDGYAANFFNYYADILRLQTDTKGQLTGYAYADWLKAALKKNQPWDSMVRELLTTDGASWDSGAIGFYMRDQGMQLDHLAATVQVFLGTQIVCAQCHNHPFDKWSQMDYYHMAAFTYGMDAKKGYGLNLESKIAPDKASRKSPEAIALRKDLKSVQESVKEVSKVLRYTSITETDRLPTLPHDYKYADAKPGEKVEPKTMFGHDAVQKDGETRIDSFAQWMTSPENPRFTLVIANRLWKRAMGMGLIEPVDEMTDSTTPSNAELMSYLEKLMVEKKYDLKGYLRVIFNSDAYQRMPSAKDVALGDVYHFTGPLMRRMSAEQAWDSIATLIKGNIDGEAIKPNLAAEKKLDALGKLYDTLSNKDPRELVADIKAKGGAESPEKLAKIKELTEKSAELRRQNKKEEAQALQKEISSLRNSGRGDAFAAVLGDEGAREFQKDYRGSAVKAKGGKGKDGLVRASVSREEIQKIKEQSGGDKKKARALLEKAQARVKQGSGIINGATRAADLPSPSPRGHLLRIFGQSDRETIENASREAAVPQALSMLNGPVADALLNDVSAFSQEVIKAPTTDAKMDTIFLGLLSRYPTNNEKHILSDVMAQRGENAKADVVHALLNTGEFLFVK